MVIKLSIKKREITLLKKTAQDLKKLKEKFPKQLTDIISRFTLRTIALSKEEFLSGARPEKLGVVTGRLRASIRAKIDSTERTITARIGTDVPYAAIHEFGGTLIKKSKTGKTFNVKMKKRSFLEPAVLRNLPKLKKDLEDMFLKVRIGRG